MLEYTLCNELLHADGLSLAEQARVAAELGYVGLELAPATLGDAPHNLRADEIRDIREIIESAGIRVTGLHWLLSGYPGASITDPSLQSQSRDILLALIDLCSALGGDVLVHGSPKQRVRPDGMDDDDLTAHLAQFFAPVADAAETAGVTYCIEPLSPTETDTINTVAQGEMLVKAINSSAFRTMIDISAAGQTEPPVADLIGSAVPSGAIAHIHANDTNRGAPGMGDDPFHDIISAIIASGWNRPVGIEPFRTLIDGRITAAFGIATLRAYERAIP